MIFNYDLERYNYWKENLNVSFQRKLENETAFDGIVKIYSLKTTSESLNKILASRFFGDFCYSTPCGLLLRMFENKNSWPETTLVFLDFKKLVIIELLKTKSSWNAWTAKDLGNNRYSIKISPNEKFEFTTF